MKNGRRILLLRRIHWKVFSFCLFFPFIGVYTIKAENSHERDRVTIIQQNQITISGYVKDASGEPLYGVSVSIPNSSTGTITDANGWYRLAIPPNSEIRFTYIGFITQTKKTGTRDLTLDVTLEEDSELLDEVVIIGYGTQKKITLTGAVSSVTTKDLVQSPQANISNALAGRMPGLLAVQRSGEPGKDASTLRIRGIGSFATSNDSDLQAPLVMVDGVETNNYNNIDPNEIESLTILKDAASTAIYGVRGANGVILITTKRGELGKPVISVSTNFAITNFPFLRESMNSYEYANAYNQAQAYDSYITGNSVRKYSDSDIEKYRTHSDPVFYPDMDWYDYMLKDYSTQSQTNINMRGGTERVKYFFSLGYFTQNGMLNTDIFDPGFDYQIKYKRYNIRSNFDIKVTNNLTASLDFSTQIGDLRGPNWDTGLLMEMLSSVTPNSSPGVIDNKIITIPSVTNTSWTPLAAYNKGWHRDYETSLDGSIRLNYTMDYLLKGLALRGAVSYKNFNNDIKKYEQVGMGYEARRWDDGTIAYIPGSDLEHLKYGSEVKKNRRIYLEGGVTYNQKFGNHNVTGLVLYNQSKYHSPDLAFLIPNGYQGIISRFTYNFADRYVAETSLNYNGTENFAKGNRFGFFPSFSLGWIISSEPYFPENDIVTFAKLRASYGIVGNDKIGGDRFLYRPTSYTYTPTNSPGYYFGEIGSNYQGYVAANEGKLGNPFLTWEESKQLDLGGSLRFYKNKIGLEFAYYSQKRDNILANRGTVPQIIGANMPAYNLGKMKNEGIEGEITYNDMFGDFNVFAKGIFTYAHNTIEFQDEVDWKYPYQYRTGQRFGQFFGYVADGLYNTWEEVNDVNRPVYMWNNNKIQPGDIRYKDINGDGKINNEDQVPIGYSNFPEVTFGLSLGGSYKGFDFSVFFQGATRVSNLPSRRTMRGFYTDTGANKDLLKSWSQERYEKGQEIRYPRYSITNDEHNYVTSTYWLEDATYLRLKNAEIGYTFKKKMLEKIGIGSLRIYANGSNLLTWCDLFAGEDPEYPTGQANTEPYPITRVYNVGLTINFK